MRTPFISTLAIASCVLVIAPATLFAQRAGRHEPVLVSLVASQEATYEDDTPQIAFQRMQQAFIDEDFQTAVDQLGPKSQEQITGKLIFALGFLSKMGSGEKKDNAVRLLEKYDLDPDDKPEPPEGVDPDDQEAVLAANLKAAAATIADKPAFIVEFYELHYFSKTDEQKKVSFALMKEGTLANVKVDGDAGTGTLTHGDQTQDLAFTKINDRWYVDPDESTRRAPPKSARPANDSQPESIPSKE